jgi:hypothetical protein
MTKRELAIIMAYTDVTTLTGDDLKYLYDYLSELAERAVYTHEMPEIIDKYKETLIRSDFVKLCENASDE